MIQFTPKATKYERVPTKASFNTWKIRRVSFNMHSWRSYVLAAANYTLIYLKKGEIYFERPPKEKEIISKNTILCIAPYHTFTLRPAQAKEVEFLMIEFDCTHFPFFEFDGSISTGVSQTAESLFYCLENVYNQKDNDYVIDSYLVCILDEMKRYINKTSRQELMINKIREYIRNNIEDKITPDVIANAFGYNKEYLARILQKNEHQTLKKLIIEEKISIAKNLLLFTDFSIPQIGKKIGFENPNDFHKFFKYHTNRTPISYRTVHHM